MEKLFYLNDADFEFKGKVYHYIKCINDDGNSFNVRRTKEKQYEKFEPVDYEFEIKKSGKLGLYEI